MYNYRKRNSVRLSVRKGERLGMFSHVNIAGREMTIQQWCVYLRQDTEQISRRLECGWEIFDALNLPTN